MVTPRVHQVPLVVKPQASYLTCGGILSFQFSVSCSVVLLRSSVAEFITVFTALISSAELECCSLLECKVNTLAGTTNTSMAGPWTMLPTCFLRIRTETQLWKLVGCLDLVLSCLCFIRFAPIRLTRIIQSFWNFRQWNGMIMTDLFILHFFRAKINQLVTWKIESYISIKFARIDRYQGLVSHDIINVCGGWCRPLSLAPKLVLGQFRRERAPKIKRVTI